MVDRRDIGGFERTAEVAAQLLKGASSVLVIGHIDADGITASSIASAALSRAGVGHTVRFVKKLDDAAIEMARSHPADKLWFVDLGSGAYSKLEQSRCVVSDHHRIDPLVLGTVPNDGHVNPHLWGLDGSSEISGAGVTYLVAKKMDLHNRDLSALAVVGAVGDFQDGAESRLIGYNRTILDDAINIGLVKAEKDVRLFGRQTRPLPAILQYSSDPALLPFIIDRARTGKVDLMNEDLVAQDEDRMACIDLLLDLGIELKDEEGYRSWAQLTREEKRRIVSALVNRIADHGKGISFVRRLIGEVYSLSPDLPGAPAAWLHVPRPQKADVSVEASWRPDHRVLLDAKEFATLLNACGRHDRAELGMAVCLGDRGNRLEEALRQQDDHRASLRKAIELVKSDGTFRPRIASPQGIPLKAVRFFHGLDQIEETIVGIVAGMLLGTPEVPADRPLIAFAQSNDGTCTIKVSGRGTRDLIGQGLDLSTAMRTASERVGGSGGGHNIAAGASIPEGTEEEFILTLDDVIRSQLHLGA